jgi:hypothetical protein
MKCGDMEIILLTEIKPGREIKYHMISLMQKLNKLTSQEVKRPAWWLTPIILAT